MKQLLLIAILCTVAITNGQEKKDYLTIKKDTWAYGGNISLNFRDNENRNLLSANNSESFSVSFNPKIGYAIKDNLIVGIKAGYTYNKNKGFNNINNNGNILYDENTLSYNKYEIGPFVRKFFPVGKKLALFLQGEFNYSHSANKNERQPNSNPEQNTIFIGIRPGITYFLNNKIALEANIGVLGYSHSTYDLRTTQQNKATSSNFGFNLNSSNLLFGITLYN